MMLRPIRKTAPGITPVSVDEVKANSRISGSDDDQLVGALIAAAVSHMDGWSGILGRCLIDQEWTFKAGCWPSGRMALPFPDVSAVVLTYIDRDGAEQTLAGGNYRLIETSVATEIEWISGFQPPPLASRSDAISIDMTVGYGAAADDVPEAIRQAIKLLVGHWYENRETVVVGTIVADLPFAVSALLAPHRRVSI